MKLLPLALVFAFGCAESKVVDIGQHDSGSAPHPDANTPDANRPDATPDADSPDADPGHICGGIGGIACPSDQVCRYEVGMCGVSDLAGTCMPAACAEIFAPVCGCDDHTYANQCDADVAGIAVAHDGACETTGATCGGFTGLSCGTGEFCKYPDGTCGLADGAGSCELRPGACPANYAPVCGCDGDTYSNACMADAAGVAIDHSGGCS